ncbi:hypothetical protein [Thermus tengchongensis]|uniref:hypothetical protein n=1 Tax=Thermus tengchongensis TaxID=1214928 RepID=UPI000571D3B9|nr:hypothetical protein [Thermus tengchongensis]
MSEVLRGLLLARAEIVPAEGEALALMEARRSWVVEVEGQRYTEGRGFLGLLLASPFRPLALLWRLPGFPWLADRAYRLVADRRPSPGWTLAHLPYRELRPNPLPAVLLALAFSGVYGYLSWKGLVEAYRGVRPEVSTTLGSLGLDLRWGHFAPTPPGRKDWVQAQGVTVTGQVVDPGAGCSWGRRPTGRRFPASPSSSPGGSTGGSSGGGLGVGGLRMRPARRPWPSTCARLGTGGTGGRSGSTRSRSTGAPQPPRRRSPA